MAETPRSSCLLSQGREAQIWFSRWIIQSQKQLFLSSRSPAGQVSLPDEKSPLGPTEGHWGRVFIAIWQ